MKMSDVCFERLIPNENQITVLYELLTLRSHAISHIDQPTFEQHEAFVKNNPYRSWYLVKINEQAVGSFYVSNQNTIGINVEGHEEVNLISQILKYITKKYLPLEPVKSVRSGVFAVNISPTNKALLNVIEGLGAEVMQLTYHLPNNLND